MLEGELSAKLPDLQLAVYLQDLWAGIVNELLIWSA